ncbi:MAG: HlyD family efflux transporter periplasmic adaptor subunit [Phascolarctobacterium sp.]|uniref:HlyD family secretion protein n=1 Tax=Phascolarctobacterium sp. TaxID=2049039 RepID=UPI0026DBDCC6|nr:HlyD family efflux transporter periplasmic adaptor subunit [Phascolarctobacterium sp.]MDO4920391.1 HlyD family efflux transporter periplasmic adaptor subunit [Phascolarctobacterium sp.]
MRYCKLFLTLLLTALLLSGCSNSGQSKKIGSAPLSIPSYEVKSPASGQIIGLITEKGERISKGQPLFAISDPQLDAQVKQLAEQTAKAAAELNRLEQSSVNAAPPGNLASAQAKLAEAQQKAAKMNSLLAQGAVSRQQAQAAQAELQQASASFQAASQAAVSSQPASPQAIAAQQKLLEQLKRQQAQATARQQANEASSPCTGIVTQLQAANNDSVRQGEAILELTAVESCQISFDVSAAEAKALTVGQKVTLKAAGASFGGSISAINGSNVTVISDNKPADLPAGTATDIYLAN